MNVCWCLCFSPIHQSFTSNKETDYLPLYMNLFIIPSIVLEPGAPRLNVVFPFCLDQTKRQRRRICRSSNNNL